MADLKRFVVLSVLSLLMGCKAITPETKKPYFQEHPRDITVFIDGTNNTKEDNTNIWRLYDLSLENEGRASFYTVGVGGGPDLKPLGSIFGTGIGNDVRESYKFICSTYQKSRNDRLHLFGFSRGAYTTKVLANLIYVAGVLELEDLSQEDTKTIVKRMYRAYRGRGDFAHRKKKINKFIRKWEEKHKMTLRFQNDVRISTLNMFDTVEALTWPDYKEDQCYPNANHLGQFVNVDKVYHAVSLDDNRAQIFTPILASCSEMQVRRSVDSIVEEVWFAGAHSDVGGGYKTVKNNTLRHVSLRWLMGELKQDYNLFETESFGSSDHCGIIHDAEDYGLVRYIYKRKQRQVGRYLDENNSYYNGGRIKIHESVIDRLAEMDYCAPIIFRKGDERWFHQKEFKNCFKKEEDGTYTYQEDNCNTIQVVKSKI